MVRVAEVHSQSDAHRKLGVRNSEESEQAGQIIPGKPRPRGRLTGIKGGANLAAAVQRVQPGGTCLIDEGTYPGAPGSARLSSPSGPPTEPREKS